MITLERAKKILSTPDNHVRGLMSPDFLKALKLGVEAVKRLEALRVGNIYQAGYLLPGEVWEKKEVADVHRRG